MYALLWAAPFTGVHYLAYVRQRYWGVAGGVRRNLQTLLLKKFLNYNDASRSKVPIEHLVMSMVRDVRDATTEGYLVSLDLFSGAVLKIVYLILAMVYLQTSSGKGVNVLPLMAVLALPVLILIFLAHRQEPTFELRSRQFKTENAAIGETIKNVLNYQLIADYDRRTFQEQNYAEVFDAFKKASTLFNSSTTNSKFFAPWLTTVLVSAWIVYGGAQVAEQYDEDPTVLAAFLSTIALFRSIGGEFEKAYGLSLRVTAAYASIVQVTVFLNLPVDVPKRRADGRRRRSSGGACGRRSGAPSSRGRGRRSTRWWRWQWTACRYFWTECPSPTTIIVSRPPKPTKNRRRKWCWGPEEAGAGGRRNQRAGGSAAAGAAAAQIRSSSQG